MKSVFYERQQWSHIPIIFSTKDVNLASFPHTNDMVILVHIAKWNVSRILVDNGSKAEILFLSTFEKMGNDKNQLKELMKPLYGFGGKRIKPVRVITLPISFCMLENSRSEHIFFAVMDMPHPYNTIFGRGLLNTLEVALHSAYLWLKILATFNVITIFDSQKEPRNIERGFILEHMNMHFLRENSEHEHPLSKQETSAEFKKVIQLEGEFTGVALNPKFK
jgi:hypothetical protein